MTQIICQMLSILAEKVLYPARAVTGRRCPHSAQCAVCKVYFSAQPNKLKPILKGLNLVQALGGQEIGLFWLVDSYWGYLISHWLAILLFMVGFSTKPNAETVVCHWIMIWCWLFLTRIDVMYIVQDRLGLLADENGESLGAVNCGHLYIRFFWGRKSWRWQNI